MGNEGNTWLNVPVETKETELTMILLDENLKSDKQIENILYWKKLDLALQVAKG
jgi:hypothetical protein